MAQVLGVIAPVAAGCHFSCHRLERRAASAQYLPTQEVQRLYASGSFMNWVEAVIAIKLLNIEITRIAVTSMDLDRQVIRCEPIFGRPRLGDWGESSSAAAPSSCA